MAQLSEVHGPEPSSKKDVRGSAWDLFEQAVLDRPNELALASVHQKPDLFGLPSLPSERLASNGAETSGSQPEPPYLRWTFQTLRSAISRLGAGLQKHQGINMGTGNGTIIFTFLPNCAEFITLQWAAYELGTIFVPISPRNLENDVEVKAMVRTALLAGTPTHDRSIIVVGTGDVSKKVDSLLQELQVSIAEIRAAVKIVVDNKDNEQRDAGRWIRFGHVMMQDHDDQDEAVVLPRSQGKPHEAGAVLFTSGTTSVPKGVLHNYSAGYSHHLLHLAAPRKAPGRVCLVLPNNHLLALYSHWFALCLGSAVVFPGPSFEAEQTIQTLLRERITHIDLVPTMLHALLGSAAFHAPDATPRLPHLDSVLLAGAAVTPETIRLATEVLGARSAEALFGMTEGPVIRGGALPYPDVCRSLVSQGQVSVGFAGPSGHGFRVADAETGRVLPRDALGELHVSGAAVTKGYLGGIDSSSFYTERDESSGQQTTWFKTGDQARIDAAGRLFITGRYKEMIIRGGENISPVAVEAAIRKEPRLAALDPQVVGVPDAIAGEVPAVVLRFKDGVFAAGGGVVSADLRDAIRRTVISHMGSMYVPAHVLAVHELGAGIVDYPRTMSAKIKKAALADMVRRHLALLEGRGDAGVSRADGDAHLLGQVTAVWARAIGQDASRMDVEAPVSTFADSIVVMRVRDIIKRTLGAVISLAEINKAKNIVGQVAVLKEKRRARGSREGQEGNLDKGVLRKRVKRDGPPTIEDMVHLRGAQDVVLSGQATREAVERHLAPFGLRWNDVEDVTPGHDNLNMQHKADLLRLYGQNVGLVAKRADKAQLRGALERVLQNNRVLASFMTSIGGGNWDNSLHICMRHDKKLFDLVFEDGGSLGTTEALKHQLTSYNNAEKVPISGLLTRVVLFDIDETGTAGALIALHHTIMDAYYLQLVYEDVERALGGDALVLREHTDFQTWADAYYSLRTTPEATAAVHWHVQRLRGLDRHIAAGGLYPPVGASAAGDGACAILRHKFDVPDLHTLRRQHPGISPAVVLKAAVSLWLVRRTGHTHALFSNFEAARQKLFPFLPAGIATSLMPEGATSLDASDVAGPLFTTVLNAVPVPTREAAGAFLTRLQGEQQAQSEHAAAPLQRISAALAQKELGEGAQADALLHQVMRSLLFNWSPGVGEAEGPAAAARFAHFTLLTHIPPAWCGNGLIVRAGLGGPNGDSYVLIMRTCHFDAHGLKGVAEELETITRWLVRPGNWEARVEELEKEMGRRQET